MVLFVAAGLLHDAPAQGQSASCYLSPGMEKTFIFVREVDSDGNPLGQLGSGWVNQGERMPITSSTGSIVIAYRLSSSDKQFQMDPVRCAEGNVISVP